MVEVSNESRSSLDSDVFENEKKEFFESDYNLESSAWLYGICLFIVLSFFIPAIYVFVSQKVYTQEKNYVWVFVFLTAQLLSIFVVNPLVCFFIAMYVYKVR